MKRRRSQRLSRRLRQRVEAASASLAAALLPRLSRRTIVRLSRVLGRMGATLARRDRRIAEANLDVVFGNSLSPQRRQEIIRRSFQSFALMMLDVFWLSRRTRDRMEQVFRLGENWKTSMPLRPMIAVTGHLGNWDASGLGLAAAGVPLASVAMPLQNAAVDRLLTTSREATGMTVIPRQGAIRPLLRHLRHNGVVALLMDQNTLPEEGGEFLPFFGLPAPVSLAVELLAQRTGAYACVAWCLPDEHGIYNTYGGKPLTFSPSDDTAPHHVTRRVLSELEDAIREHPENWLWSYRRWRYIPPGGDPNAYPFYAREYNPE